MTGYSIYLENSLDRKNHGKLYDGDLHANWGRMSGPGVFRRHERLSSSRTDIRDMTVIDFYDVAASLDRFFDRPGVERSNALEALEEVYQECSQEDWDGYGATPVTRNTLANARSFLNQLPVELSVQADPGAEPDGHLTLGWYANSDQQISISIDADQNMYYAAHCGSKRRQHGADSFSRGIPAYIVQLIRDVVNSD